MVTMHQKGCIDKPDSTFRRAKDVSTRRQADGRAILYQSDSGREKEINEIGYFIWSRLDGCHRIGDIVQAIEENFSELSGQVARDVELFLRDLENERLIAAVQRNLTTSAVDNFSDEGDAPRSLDVSVTGHCNLSCAYCFYCHDMKRRPDLGLDEWATFLPKPVVAAFSE